MSDQVDLDLEKLNGMVKFLREEALNPDKAPSHWERSQMIEAAKFSLTLDAIINDLKSSQMASHDLSDAVSAVKNLIGQVRQLYSNFTDQKLDFDQWSK